MNIAEPIVSARMRVFYACIELMLTQLKLLMLRSKKNCREALIGIKRFICKDEVSNALIRWTFLLGVLFLSIGLYLQNIEQAKKEQEDNLIQIKSKMTTEDFEKSKAIDFALWASYCAGQEMEYAGNWTCKKTITNL